MYTPPKPAIVPKTPITDLPCATNPGQQPSKPAPVYQPPTSKPPVAAPVPIPAPIAPPVSAPKPPGTWVPPFNPAPTVASMQSELSTATQTISQASLALGYPGKAGGFLAFAVTLAAELKMLRAKK